MVPSTGGCAPSSPRAPRRKPDQRACGMVHGLNVTLLRERRNREADFRGPPTRSRAGACDGPWGLAQTPKAGDRHGPTARDTTPSGDVPQPVRGPCALTAPARPRARSARDEETDGGSNKEPRERQRAPDLFGPIAHFKVTYRPPLTPRACVVTRSRQMAPSPNQASSSGDGPQADGRRRHDATGSPRRIRLPDTAARAPLKKAGLWRPVAHCYEY
jgi:hypothetical protein